MTHLRGQNGHTQCGTTITRDMLVLGLVGFRVAHGTVPTLPGNKGGVCLRCLEKSRTMKTPK